jgi:putative transposase
VAREKASHAVVTLCRVLGISPSGYWAWRQRQRTPSARSQVDAQLAEQIRTIHQASRGT